MKNISLILLIFLAACGGQEIDKLSEKKKELEEKEKLFSNLRTEIAHLKTEIEALDTNARSNAIAVRAIKVERGTFKNPFQLQGLVESDQNILITPEVPAKIVKIHVKEGQKVNKGQLIATLDGSVARSQIQEMESALELAEINYLKQKRLWEQNIGSEMQYLQAKNQYENLLQGIETARQQLGKYTLNSPISGTVDEIMANEGELVGSLTGGPIARIVNLTDIKIKASVSEKYVGLIKKGQVVKVYLPSLDLELTEKIDAVSNVIDINNRTFHVYIKPSGNQNMLKPNMLALITAYDYIQDNVISVPTRLVRSEDGKDFILTLKEQGNKRIVQKTYVEIEQEFASESIIKSGLEEGTLIITEGYTAVIEGDEVKIIE